MGARSRPSEGRKQQEGGGEGAERPGLHTSPPLGPQVQLSSVLLIDEIVSSLGRRPPPDSHPTPPSEQQPWACLAPCLTSEVGKRETMKNVSIPR